MEDIQYNHHSNAGGVNGLNGRTGGEYTYPLNAGKAGEEGLVQLQITSNGAVVSTHKEPFNISINSAELVSNEASGLWEPGDTINATYTIKNTAKTMSSPPETITLTLDAQEGIEFIHKGKMAGSIPAGSEHQSTIPITFKIKAPSNYSGSTPYINTLPITVIAENTRLNSPFPKAYKTKNLTVQYPVQLEQGPREFLISEDESQTLDLIVTNISQKTIGADVGRKLFVELVPEISKASHSPTSKSTSIGSLKPEHSHQISKKVSFPKGARWGDKMHFSANLYLQPIDRSKQATLIQSQPVQVQLTPHYLPDQHNGFLLVINSETSQEALNYWFNTLQKIAPNEKVSVWNTSYYGHLNLDNSSSLMSDTAHGTVVVLNNAFNLDAKLPLQRNSHFIQEQFYKGSLVNDVSLLVVGEQGELPKAYTGDDFVEENQLKPSDQVHLSVDELMKQLLNENELTRNLKEPVVHQLKLQSDDQQQVLRDTLAKTFKNRRYQVSLCKSKGILTVERLADPLDSEIKRIALSDKALETPENRDLENQTSVINALPFSQKLRLFTQTGNQYHRQLAESIKYELLAEQSLLLQSQAYGTWWQRIIGTFQHPFNYELIKLRQLLNSLQQMSIQGDVNLALSWSPLVLRLIAEVQYHAEQHSSFWTRFIHFFVPQTNEQIKENIQGLSTDLLNEQCRLSDSQLEGLQQEVLTKKHQIDLEKRVQEFIENHEPNSASRLKFFSSHLALQEELAGAKQLLKVCNNDALPITLSEHLEVFNRSALLKPFFDEYKNLYPELMNTPRVM